jgi:hypothetical protein
MSSPLAPRNRERGSGRARRVRSSVRPEQAARRPRSPTVGRRPPLGCGGSASSWAIAIPSGKMHTGTHLAHRSDGARFPTCVQPTIQGQTRNCHERVRRRTLRQSSTSSNGPRATAATRTCSPAPSPREQTPCARPAPAAAEFGAREGRVVVDGAGRWAAARRSRSACSATGNPHSATSAAGRQRYEPRPAVRPGPSYYRQPVVPGAAVLSGRRSGPWRSARGRPSSCRRPG